MFPAVHVCRLLAGCGQADVPGAPLHGDGHSGANRLHGLAQHRQHLFHEQCYSGNCAFYAFMPFL